MSKISNKEALSFKSTTKLNLLKLLKNHATQTKTFIDVANLIAFE